MELADSISLDPHKWLYQPLDCGCLLYRSSEAAQKAFSHSGDYTRALSADPIEGFAFFEESLELSRRFRALKLWLSLRYHGLAAYNQVFGGVGYKYSYTSRFNINFQLALGSGGYAPERIDTGSGLLIYPKLSTEYRLSNSIGLLLSSGYLYAPRGSSRNLTLGASLVYHASPDGGSAHGDHAATEVAYRGHRFHIFSQTEFKVKVGDRDQGKVKLLSVQVDNTVSDNNYIPVQGSIAYNSYFGYPGYGEVLAGIGAQNKYTPNDSFQTFAQLLIGTNVHGIIVKPALGVNFGLSDRLAVYGQVGSTLSLDNVGLYPKQRRFRSTSVGLGLSYRFSLPL